ncbi:DUF2975 domain-containing protein [Christiangramia salexigens]|uniref:DUF2975 domain-containing protein n=1 Tax=Christiangramia salexigens TaxID=1913577 RepID=UPI0018DBBF09|nr:DUF2975 domain-containing protein [Christiangramia salexigens]
MKKIIQTTYYRLSIITVLLLSINNNLKKVKSSVVLRNIISITYYLMVFSWLIILGIFTYSIIADENSALQIFKEYEEFTINSKRALITILLYELIMIGFWIYLFRLIKNLMDSLTSKSIFTKFQISSFKLIGQLIILLKVIDTLFAFLFDIIFKDRVRFKIDFVDFWLIIALGLFFIFISQIFNRARPYKEENELTV